MPTTLSSFFVLFLSPHLMFPPPGCSLIGRLVSLQLYQWLWCRRETSVFIQWGFKQCSAVWGREEKGREGVNHNAGREEGSEQAERKEGLWHSFSLKKEWESKQPFQRPRKPERVRERCVLNAPGSTAGSQYQLVGVELPIRRRWSFSSGSPCGDKEVRGSDLLPCYFPTHRLLCLTNLSLFPKLD